MVGIPYYGRGWTGVPARPTTACTRPAPRPGAPTRPASRTTRCSRTGRAPVFRDTADGALWKYDGSTFWSYDDPKVIAQKTAYVKSNGLGGVMVWSLDGDDGTLVTAVDTGLS